MNYDTIEHEKILKDLKASASLIFTLGFLLVIFGILAAIFSFASTLLSVLFLGALLLAIGVLEAIKAFTVQRWPTFFLHFLLSIFYVIGGIFIISNPAINAITLTLLLAIVFMISGIFKIFFALIKQPPHAFWLFFNGALSLLLGILIWQQWPISGLWALGLFIGIDMILTGMMWIMLASAAQNTSL